MIDALIKIGGSLYSSVDLPELRAHWARLAQRHRILALPGGGPFADQVRAADTRYRLSDSAAHWMAILAMDQYAYLLADLIPNAMLIRDHASAKKVCKEKRLTILAPSTLLLEHDPLPHSWNVTSDSIAAWVAARWQIKLLVLIKSTEMPTEEAQVDDLVTSELVDPYFGDALQPETTCWIVDGRQPEHLAALLKGETRHGLRVYR